MRGEQVLSSLKDKFSKTIKSIGFQKLVHPIFYNSEIGIRFEIGNPKTNNYVGKTINPKYINEAFDRAITLYQNLPHPPDVLRIDMYPAEEVTPDHMITLENICDLGLVQPLEIYDETVTDEDDSFIRRHLYWDLTTTKINTDMLLREIILSDFGRISGLASNVYFINTQDNVLFHMYDDRGADVISADKELLRPLYEKYNSWILSYDKEQIDKTFAK